MDIIGIEDVKTVAPGGAAATLLALLYNFSFRRHESHRKTASLLFKKLDALNAELNNHKIDAARTFISRDEFLAFRTHIDLQFDRLTQRIDELPTRIRNT